MTLAPPGVAHRWSVVGHTPDGWECTTLFDLPHVDRNVVVVHPAAVDKYTVVIYRAGVEMLMDTMKFGNACSVPAEHEVHGGRLLCLRPVTLPHEPSWTARPADAPPSLGPMELYLRLPDAQISIIFKRERVLKLATILADILTLTEKHVSGKRIIVTLGSVVFLWRSDQSVRISIETLDDLTTTLVELSRPSG